MGLNFLPINSIKWIIKANRRSKAIKDATREAGLDINNYWNWSAEDHRRCNTHVNKKLKELGLEEYHF